MPYAGPNPNSTSTITLPSSLTFPSSTLTFPSSALTLSSSTLTLPSSALTLPSSRIISVPSGNPDYRNWPLSKITFGISRKKQQDLNDSNTNSILPSSLSTTTTTTTTSESSILVKTVEIVEKKSEPQMIKNNKNDDNNNNIESDVDRDNALKQVKDILSTSPQLSTSPSQRRRSSPETYSRKLSLKVDLSSAQQQFTSEMSSEISPEMSPRLLRKKSGEILKSSLKRGKSEPVTPTYAYFPKYVRFNATNLEQVKLFDGAKRPQAVSAEASDEDTDEIDEFDFSVSSSEEDDDDDELIIKIPTLPPITTEHCSKYVFVESIFLSTDKRKLQGRIHVKNIAFQKIVQIRYTFDFWQSVSEVTAKYATTTVNDNNNNNNNNNNNRNKLKNLNDFDLFHFSIELIDNSRNPIDGKVMYFAVHYQVNGCDYWDNNNGQNYQVNFKRVSSSSNQSSHRSITEKKKNNHNNNSLSYFNNKWPPQSKSSSSSSSSSLRHAKALEASSPPVITKNTTKKSSRYDLSVSLSAAKNLTSTFVKNSSSTSTTTTTSSLSLSTSRSIINNNNNNNNNNNLKAPLTPGDDPVHQYFPSISYGNENYSSFFPGNYIDGMPGTTDVSISPVASSSWGDVKSSSSNPIAIPSTKSPIGSSAYYDLVNQYCFYQGSPYTASSPFASSPIASSRC
ncbi:hypothetical protein Glove_261g87 [Diversispora epigaea]|uniref:CBM21 domain-containing protein n=1 Tax=Diversispora epigaea TaxID=1348612 RepID=A0A397IEN9_9GLOM|nr:hypothetical protein Glove_261g87 [Diversispora epigaea]